MKFAIFIIYQKNCFSTYVAERIQRIEKKFDLYIYLEQGVSEQDAENFIKNVTTKTIYNKNDPRINDKDLHPFFFMILDVLNRNEEYDFALFVDSRIKNICSQYHMDEIIQEYRNFNYIAGTPERLDLILDLLIGNNDIGLITHPNSIKNDLFGNKDSQEKEELLRPDTGNNENDIKINEGNVFIVRWNLCQYFNRLNENQINSYINNFRNKKIPWSEICDICELKLTARDPEESEHIRIIAFYYPQFHRFEENDKFWGNGFTEWDNLRRASAQFEGHHIKRPSDFGYYDLLDKNTRKKQARLAQNYNIYGFCYYHYWFSHAKNNKVMYEVKEKLLDINEEPNIPFCFEWANEPWTRKWDGLENEVLIKQDYGGRDEWEKHYNYLSKFFKLKNYIKIDNKPLLLIYRIGHIYCFKHMRETWEELAIRSGFDGLHIVQCLGFFQDSVEPNSYCDAYCEYQPCYLWNMPALRMKMQKVLNQESKDNYIGNASENWKHINKITIPIEIAKTGKEYYRGMYVGWDSTPRAIGRPAIIDLNDDPENFKLSLIEQFKNIKDDDNKNKFLFLFAWNEWGEGAVLERNDYHGIKMLEMVKSAYNDY